MSVISLPDRDETVKQAVTAAWEYLEAVETIEDLRYERKKAKVKQALEGISDEEAFDEIQSRRGAVLKPEKTVRVAEIETLMASKEEIGDDKPDGTFFARTLPRTGWDFPWMQAIERVVLVHRLREVIAQVGFTRFESAAPDIEGELEIGVRRASLAREISWLPSVENRGEGIFLQFDADAIFNWMMRPDVISRGQQLEAGFNCWKEEHKGTQRQFFGLPYVMLHSFSHLLVTAVALECGIPPARSASAFTRCPASAMGFCSIPAPRMPKARWAVWSRSAGGFTSMSATPWSSGNSVPTIPLCPASAAEYPRAAFPARRRLSRLPADR